MELSEPLDYSGALPCISPDALHLAAPVGLRLTVRDAESLKVSELFMCQDRIAQLAWCPRSEKIACRLHARDFLQVWSIRDTTWRCKVHQGPSGAVHCTWSPDGSTLLVASDFNLRLSAWNLRSRAVVHLKGPKQAAQGLQFSPDGKRMATLERRNLQDLMALTSTGDWQRMHSFPVHTEDAAGLSWSPSGTCLTVWDAPITYRVAVYTPQGQMLGSFSAYDEALGVRCTSWNPSGQLLAVGSCDKAIRLLNHQSWQSLGTFTHAAAVDDASCPDVVVYQQVADESEDAREDAVLGAIMRGRSSQAYRFIVCELPIQLPSTRLRPDAIAKDVGIEWQAWSPSGEWLASCEASMGHVVWLWNVPHSSLGSCVVLQGKLRQAAWHPSQACLLLLTHSTSIFLWTPQGASCLHVPIPAFRASHAQWSSCGRLIMLADHDRYVVAFLGEPDG